VRVERVVAGRLLPPRIEIAAIITKLDAAFTVCRSSPISSSEETVRYRGSHGPPRGADVELKATLSAGDSAPAAWQGGQQRPREAEASRCRVKKKSFHGVVCAIFRMSNKRQSARQ